jgi:thiol-disulfide isomerase/thioredoxin
VRNASTRVVLLGLTLLVVWPRCLAAQEQEAPERPPVYDEAADARTDIAAALAVAARKNKRVLIQWGGNWCGWCIKLHDLFASDRTIAMKILYEYEVVTVDIGHWDKNLDLVEHYGADIQNNGVPFLTVLDADGNVLVNQDTGSLEEGDHHDPALVLAFLEAHQAPYPEAEVLLADALRRAGQEGKRLFLAFGAPT